ncbi:MAG: hypothetical protein ACYDHX_17525 [Methanothrix sp.]
MGRFRQSRWASVGGRACLRGPAAWGAGFLEAMAVRYYYHLKLYPETTDRTTEAQRHRDALGAIPGSLHLCDPCGPRASRARQPIDRAASSPRARAHGRRSWAGPSGLAAMLSERAGLPDKRS